MRDFVKNAKPGCPKCSDNFRVELRWLDTPELKLSEEDLQYKEYIEFKQNLKTAKHYQCKICQSDWVSVRKIFIHYFSVEEFQKIREWADRPCVISPNFMSTLIPIGATSTDKYGNGSEAVRFPCCVTTNNGKTYQKAIVAFVRDPIFFYLIANYMYADTIASITESPYALPGEVRRAYSEIEEVAYSHFTTTYVLDGKGKPYRIFGQPEFLDFDGLRGKDVKLRGPEGPKNIVATEVNNHQGEAEVHFVADWFEGVEQLREF